MKTILIVGGAGYIGSHTAKFLASKGYEVVVFDNLSTGHKESVKWGKLFIGDIRYLPELFEGFMPLKSVDAVIHFAAAAYVGESMQRPAKYYLNNVAGAINLIDYILNPDKTTPFIFSSSCSIYGIPINFPISETDTPNPISPYGRSKLMIEQILSDYDRAYKFPHVNLRYFNAAGADLEGEIGEAHSPETHLIPLAIQAALGGKPLRVYGHDYATADGTCIRDYIHVQDLAEAHYLALEYLLGGGKSESFNLGNGLGYSVQEVINTVQAVTGKQVPLIRDERRLGDPPVLISSSKKAREKLGWEPKLSRLETIVETAFEWEKRRLHGI